MKCEIEELYFRKMAYVIANLRQVEGADPRLAVLPERQRRRRRGKGRVVVVVIFLKRRRKYILLKNLVIFLIKGFLTTHDKMPL